MSKKEKVFREIIRQAVDLHIHVGPDVLPRKYTLEKLVRSEAGSLAGVGIKSHSFPTTPFIRELESIPQNFKVVGSLTLNNSVGGLNPEAVRTAAALTEDPIIVWFPTISAQNFLNKSTFEIGPEWVKGTDYKPRLSRKVRGISITEKGKLTDKAKEVLGVTKELDLILATGHVSWEEAKKLVTDAKKRGIERIIVTHPLYQPIDMPLSIQAELANLGAMIEVCYSMYLIDGIEIGKIAEQIKTAGPESCVLSSDVGQVASPSPSEALLRFLMLLSEKGLGEGDFYQMLVTNPAQLIG